MPEWKQHILINGFVSNEDFRSKRTGRNPVIPLQDRLAHGQHLSFRYAEILNQYQTQRTQIQNPITADIGVYVEIIGTPDCELPLQSLDTSRDFKLRSCRKVDDHEVALIFIPESKRDVFQKKLNQYLDPEKDSKKGAPRNHSLIDSIAEIKLADLRSFWTDKSEYFPADFDQAVWWELWLKKRSTDENPLDIAQQLAERINGRLGNTTLSFFDSVVVLIRASAGQLERAPELIACLEELRRAKETPNVLIESSPVDQQQWANDLLQRIQLDDTSSTVVTILDSGVNYQHPLLASVCNTDQSERWNPNWPFFDAFNPANPFAPYCDHGSRQAGLAAFGDLHSALVSDEAVVLKHRIESGRILPPTGSNDPELYGAITIGTAAKLEIARPKWNRVYSLAVTVDPERVGGQSSFLVC